MDIELQPILFVKTSETWRKGAVHADRFNVLYG
jgi:hypothetical protein